MPITEVTSTSQLDKILSESVDKLSVIDFHATWCGPCKMIAPVFQELSTAQEYKNVNFLKCDVDAVGDVARQYSVRAMPTFVFLKGRNKVGEVKGANSSALRAAVREHSSGTAGTGAFSGKGQTLGGSSTEPSGTPASVVNLSPQAKVFLYFIGAYILLWYLSS